MLRVMLPLALVCACTWGQEIKIRKAAPAAAAFEWISVEDGPGKAVTGAPYTARAVTTSTQTLADGNRITHTTEVNLARDSQGRTRREQKLGALGPWTTNESGSLVTISDPVAGVIFTLNPDGKTAMKSVRTLSHISAAGGGTIRHEAGTPVVVAGQSDQGKTMVFVRSDGHATTAGGTTSHAEAVNMKVKIADAGTSEDLGTQVIEGVAAQGKRTRLVIPAGQIGNERPIEITSETWYSAELQTVVLSKRSDPRTGETEFRLTNISRAEPSLSLFELPANLKVIEGIRHEQ